MQRDEIIAGFEFQSPEPANIWQLLGLRAYADADLDFCTVAKKLFISLSWWVGISELFLKCHPTNIPLGINDPYYSRYKFKLSQFLLCKINTHGPNIFISMFRYHFLLSQYQLLYLSFGYWWIIQIMKEGGSFKEVLLGFDFIINAVKSDGLT